MLKKIRKLVVVFAVLLCCSNTYYVQGAMSEESVPIARSVNTLKKEVNLSISKSGTANVSVKVVGKGGTTKIEALIKLQKYDKATEKWKTIKKWEKNKNGASLSFSGNYALESKGTYRCKCEVTVTCNGKKEKLKK